MSNLDESSESLIPNSTESLTPNLKSIYQSIEALVTIPDYESLTSTNYLNQSPYVAILKNIAAPMFGILSAVVYWFGAAEALDRYPSLGNISFFNWTIRISAVVTNSFFNWMGYLDCFNDNNSLPFRYKFLAAIAAVATIAPYFFIGFTGKTWQKVLVGVSSTVDLPVFYLGALNLYSYFHLPIVQWFCALFNCSQEDRRLADRKRHLVQHLKAQYDCFKYATKGERTEFINDFLVSESKLCYLVSKNNRMQLDCRWTAALYRWFLTGNGLWGLAVMLQNIPHAILNVKYMLKLKQLPWSARLVFGLVLAAGNLIPSIGFSFSTMANFDLLNFLSALVFLKIPQVQRALGSFFIALPLVVGVAVLISRYFYLFSGFGNDQVNYEGAEYVHSGNVLATMLGLIGNLSGALIFNGVYCEALFHQIMMGLVSKYGDDEDKRQADFEKDYLKIVKTIETLPLGDIRAMVSEPENQGSHSANFDTSRPGLSFFSEVHDWYFRPEENGYVRVESIENDTYERAWFH